MTQTALTRAESQSLDRYMAEVKKYPVLSRDEEHRLAMRLRDTGDVEAAHALVVSNLRFVVKVAHEYKGYGLKLIDLIQEGTVGLMIAVKKFDPDRGYRLISYAVWWIRATIQDFIQRSWSMVKLGTTHSKRKLFFKLRSTRNQLERDAIDGEPVSAADIALALDVSRADVEEAEARLAAHDFSLDQTVEAGSSVSHLDRLADHGQSPEDEVSNAQERQLLVSRVQEAMDGLNEKERHIVEAHLLADEPRTLQELGDEFKVSRERVRQIEARALKKLKSAIVAAPGGNAEIRAEAGRA